MYDFTAIKKITTQLIFLNAHTQNMFSTKCNHQHSTNFSHLCGKQSIVALNSPFLDDVKRPWQQCWYRLPMQITYSKDVPYMCKQAVITWSKITRVGRMYQHLPVPTLHQILHIMMAMSCCTLLEQNDTMLKQFWLFMVKSWPHLIL